MIYAIQNSGHRTIWVGFHAVKELIEFCHSENVLVSTGGFIEYVIAQGNKLVDKYINECKELGFDPVEISAGFITVPMDDILRLVEKVKKSASTKPKVKIQLVRAALAAAELESEGTRIQVGQFIAPKSACNRIFQNRQHKFLFRLQA